MYLGVDNFEIQEYLKILSKDYPKFLEPYLKTEEMKNASLLSELKDREKEFIKWACSELTYKEIADRMCLSPKTIDGYRDSVFVKLDIKNRAGLVLFALKHNLC